MNEMPPPWTDDVTQCKFSKTGSNILQSTSPTTQYKENYELLHRMSFQIACLAVCRHQINMAAHASSCPSFHFIQIPCFQPSAWARVLPKCRCLHAVKRSSALLDVNRDLTSPSHWVSLYELDHLWTTVSSSASSVLTKAQVFFIVLEEKFIERNK